MGDRPVTALWGIGSRMAGHLAELGIHSVRDLAASDRHVLAPASGRRSGLRLKILGMGGDRSPVVDIPHVPRSRSREETFERDLTVAG